MLKNNNFIKKTKKKVSGFFDKYFIFQKLKIPAFNFFLNLLIDFL